MSEYDFETEIAAIDARQDRFARTLVATALAMIVGLTFTPAAFAVALVLAARCVSLTAQDTVAIDRYQRQTAIAQLPTRPEWTAASILALHNARHR